MKVGPYLIYLDDCKSKETNRLILYANDDNETYFGRFGVENIPMEDKNFIGNNKNL